MTTPETALESLRMGQAEPIVTFEATLTLPPADHPPHGYSKDLIQRMREACGWTDDPDGSIGEVDPPA